MQFLTIKKQQRIAKDGKPRAKAMVVKKDRKYGNVIEEHQIKTRQSVLITGAHSSGKSYWLDRLYKDYARIWATRSESKPVYLSSLLPLTAWVDGKHFETWWALRYNPDDERHWSKLKAHERLDALPLYLEETEALLFVDDAHNLNGRKMKIVQACVRSAGIFIIAASEEGRLSPSLRLDVLHVEPQIFRLDSEVAYDATAILMWLLILLAAGLGAYELAAVLGGLKMLSGGQRAAKQN